MNVRKTWLYLCAAAGLLSILDVKALVDVAELRKEFDRVVRIAQTSDQGLTERLAATERAIEIIDTLRGEHLNSYRCTCFQGFAFGGVCIDEHVGTNAALKSCFDGIKRALEHYKTSISGTTAAAPAHHDEYTRILVLQRRIAAFAESDTAVRAENARLRGELMDVCRMIDGGR